MKKEMRIFMAADQAAFVVWLLIPELRPEVVELQEKIANLKDEVIPK